jgi:integrase
MTRLTKTKLDALIRHPPTNRTDFPDGQVPGLMLRVTPKGTMTWSMQYRVSGHGGISSRGLKLKGDQRHRITLGRYPDISISEARKVGANYTAMAERGEDPRGPLEEASAAQENTIEMLCDDFLDKYVHSRNLRSAVKFENAIKSHIVPSWGNRSAASITRRDAIALLEKVQKKRKREDGRYHGGPEAARSTKQILHRMFVWGCAQGRLEANPLSSIDDPTQIKSRDRVLTMEELRAVWRAADGIGYPFGPMYRILILTACRRNEVASAVWPWLDIDQKWMEIPAHAYKSQRPHVVPLIEPALDIVQSLPLWNEGEYLFSGSMGASPVSGFSRAKTRFDKAIASELGHPLENWRPHDFRRSAATHLRRLGVERHVVKRLLGHSDNDVTAIYDRYDMIKERRQAMTVWAEELLK